MHYFTDYEYIASSAYFDEKWYRKQYPDVGEKWKGDIAFHYLECGWKEGRNPGPYFDGDRYLKLYKKFLDEEMNPLLHYEKYGKKMGMVASPTEYTTIAVSKLFNKRWYRKKYMKGLEGDPVEHYLTIGWKQGYAPSKQFNGEKYLDKYPGVRTAGVCPLIHYERNGKLEGRVVTPVNMPEYEEKGFLWKQTQKIVLSIKSVTMPRHIREKKVLVCLHLFYPAAWKEIRCYLHNLSIYNYDLYVSYPQELIPDEIIEEIRSYKNDTVFYEFENRGYDIGPFIELLNHIDLSKYDIVFKLHSKGISRPELYMYDKFFRRKEWFQQLFRGTIGILNAHRSMKKLSVKNGKIGMVASGNLIVKDPKHKQNLVKEWCEELGIPMSFDYHFVAGTCYAERAELLRPLMDINLNLERFDVTTRGEFSLAHAVERIACMQIEQQGYEISKNSVRSWTDGKRKKEAADRKKYAAVRLLDDNRFIIDDNFFYRLVESRQVDHYEITRIPIKEIKRIWEGKRIPLSKCQPYRYLIGYRNEYYDYCDFHRDSDLPLMTKQRFDTLIASIEENGFNDKYKVIINQDNVIQDGQHRACYYLYKYGEDYELEVLKIYYRGQGELQNNVKVG